MTTIVPTSANAVRSTPNETARAEKDSQNTHAAAATTVPSAKEPEDIVEISDKVPAEEKSKETTVGNGFADFDMDAFQAAMRNKLLEMVNEAKKAAKDAGLELDAKWSEDMLYTVSEDTKAADVPEYWNAENTSQRIVDFAMSFRSLAPELNDEEFISQVRDAVVAGFRQSKDILGDLPGSVGKLFNDTYSLAMKKFDDLLEKSRSAEVKE